MNINIDNYEAYLLDYMDGNLGPEETRQLQAFVAAQGLEWNELTEELPRLEAPQIAYEGKAKLKKQSVVVPLYVKIASAAAAAGLLLTIGLWPDKTRPEIEPIAELSPIKATRIEVPIDIPKLHKKPNYFVKRQMVGKEEPIVSERVEMPMLAELEPKKATVLPTQPAIDEPNFDFLAYRLNAEFAFAQIGDNYVDATATYEEESDPSLIGKGLLWLTNGRHDSFISLINAGMSQAKQKATEAATDMALTAYHRAEESFEETRERWEEKRGE